MKELEKLGWNEFFNKQLNAVPYEQDNEVIGRVTQVARKIFKVCSPNGDMLSARCGGSLHYHKESKAELPVVGDWVILEKNSTRSTSILQTILGRQNKLSRKSAGKLGQEQVLAANIHTAFIVSSLNKEFNTRRIERYLTVVKWANINPVIILSKSDLVDNCSAHEQKIEKIAGNIPVHIISAHENSGLAQIAKYFQEGTTSIFLGSSGVGKSTLINWLLGEERLTVKSIRGKDDQGRHATTARYLVTLPSGGMVIDTPGLREIRIWESKNDVSTFTDIVDLESNCKFSDCQHKAEPGCAVIKAIEDGSLDLKRLVNYQKLLQEVKLESTRQDETKKRLAKKKDQKKSGSWKNKTAMRRRR